MDEIKCPHCHKLIEPVYEDLSFDYAGTHCTYGQSGTYHDGYWYCPKCDEELDYEPED